MRPEHENPPEIYYNGIEAKKYTQNSRIQEIQAQMTERAVELLNLPSDKTCLVLDIGCGSGLSGQVLQEQFGHYWIGMDISPAMLAVANENCIKCTDQDSTSDDSDGSDSDSDGDSPEPCGDLLLQDAGQGVGYRPGTFDGAISISCLQWLCNADYKCQNPRKRLLRFFSTLYSSLSRGARAIFQFYPETAEQTTMLTGCAMQAGFGGGLVVDYPNSTKRKKYFLCLMAGSNPGQQEPLPIGLMDGESAANVVSVGQRERQRVQRKDQRKNIKDRDWVLRKKEARRRKGDSVPQDTKYTARKRRPRF